MLISVSRRTDIPAYYMPWFMERVHTGKAVYYNPFSFKGYEISLKPEDVDVMIFISKNYASLMPHLEELQSLYRLYFHYTITGLSGIFEERVPPAEKMVQVFRELSKRTSPELVEWRFDPVLLTTLTPPEFVREQFIKLAQQLSGYTRRCYFSFATIYDRVKRAFHELEAAKGVQLCNPDIELQRQLAEELADLGLEYGIELFSCCNDYLVGGKIHKAHCIDGGHLNLLFDLAKIFPAGPTREECGCTKSVDLGVYDTCPHGCSYCYANYNKAVAWKNYLAHTPENQLLLPEKITVVKRLPEDGQQIALF